MSTDDLALPVAAPSAVGIDADGITGFVDALAAAADQELHSLAVIRHGQVCARAWWAPYVPDDATLVYSLSKSFTSTALGFAIAEGRLALTDRVVDRLAPDGPVGPRTATMTVRDLAAMATGHHVDLVDAIAAADDPARAFLTFEPESDPGSVFLYNNPATYTLGAILQEVAGTTLTDYLRPRLFEPLGVEPGWWVQQPPGRDQGFSGLHVTTEVLVRFGQLYLDGGVYAGHQVLPPGWTELATAVHTPNPGEPNPDWQQGYGFQLWRGRHGTVRADGAYGQFVVLLPAQDAVLVTTAGTGNMQGLLDAAWDHLLPAFDRAGGPDADARLVERLTGVEIVTDRPDPAVEHEDGGIAVVGVERRADGWTVVLEERGRSYSIAVGHGLWRRTDLEVAPGWGVEVAARGMLLADGPAPDAVVDVVLVETPHRLRIRTRPEGATVTWHTAPLGRSGISSLATPRPAR